MASCLGAQLLLLNAALRAAAGIVADALVAAHVALCQLCYAWHHHTGSTSPLPCQAVLHDQSTYTPRTCTTALDGSDALAGPLLLGRLPHRVIVAL